MKNKREETIDERLLRESGVTPVSQDHLFIESSNYSIYIKE